jgi:hypothetical protein
VGDRSRPLIEATNGRQFKVVFNVLQDFGGFNSYATIDIYNLSLDTEAKAFKKYDYVGLRAGYEDNIDFIFKGDIVNLIRVKQGSNRITRLICKGGALAQDTATINKSFEGGVTAPALIKELAGALGFPLVINDADFADQSPYLSGYLLSGDPKKLLNRLARSHDFKWLIENERLIVVGNASSRDNPVTIISASRGMVGVPEITEIGADVLVKLNPSLKIGARFRIESEFAEVNFSNVFFQDVPDTLGQGEYRTQKLQFDGDSYGDRWDVRVSGIR